MRFSAVILAGGQSQRMGQDKAWLQLDGRPLIARALQTVRAAGAEEVFISGRPGTDYTSLRAPVLVDLEPGFGPLGGIERGLQAAQFPMVLVLAVDLPLMTPEFIRKLTQHCDNLTGALPKHGHEVEPLAAFYPKRAHALALDLMRRFRRAAKEFAEACIRERAARCVVVARSDLVCFENWNAPADARS